MQDSFIDNKIICSDLDIFFDNLLIDIDGDWKIEFADLNDIGYDLDIENMVMVLHNYGLETNKALNSIYGPQIKLSCVEGLRMIRHVEWLNGRLERYNPQSILQIGRICVADAMVHKISLAWDCKMAEDDSMWKYILCDDLSDIAQSFSTSLEIYLSSGMAYNLAKQKACAASFHKWFSNEDRLRDCDHDTLDLIDQMVQEDVEFKNQELKGNRVGFLTLIAGENFSYLDSHLQTDVSTHSYYTNVNDTINHTHLTQVINDINKTRIGGLIFQDSTLASRFTFCE